MEDSRRRLGWKYFWWRKGTVKKVEIYGLMKGLKALNVWDV